MITTDEVIKELFEIADKKVPGQVVDRDEIRGELDELNEGKFDFSISSPSVVPRMARPESEV